MRIGLWVGMAVLLSVSPIWGISPFSASDNIVEKQAIRRHELAWIRATVELDRLSISDRDALSELRVERDLAFNRLRIREMRRVHRAHIESRSTLSDILNPKTPTEPVFDLTPTPVPKRSIQSDFQFPSFNIRASGYKNFDFNYSKGQADTGFTRSESLKLNLTGYSQDVTVNVAIDQSSLNSADQNKIQIELLHPNAQVVMGAFKTDFVSFDILKYNAQLDGIQGDFRVGSHNAGVIYSVAKGVRKKDVLYGNNSQGPFVIRFVPVVPNSEQVVLNGVVQARDQDYQIDYPSGTVRFIKRILVPEDQLILSYESENETYKDQVLGARYWMLTGQGDGIGATVIQKNDQGDQGGQTTFLKRRVAVLAADQTWASSNVHLEYAGSDMETVGNPDHTLGTASSIRLKSDDALGRWEGYWTSIGNGFQSIDSSGVTPGDVKYGGRWSRRVSQWVFGTGFDAAFQTINSIPTIEQTSQFQFETVWNTIHYKGSGQTMGHSESPVSGNKLADYRRSLADLAIEIPEHFGTVGIQGKIERREDYVATANSFDAITVASGYTLTPSDFAKGAIEGYLKSYQYPATANQIERSIKMSGSLRPNSQTNVDGYTEYREKSGDFPITTVSLSGDSRLSKSLSVSSKVSLESLKETVNAINLEMEKWDNTIRVDFDPFSFSKFKSMFKINEKRPKGDALPLFSNQEWSVDGTFIPLKSTQIVVQHHQILQTRAQYQYYPYAVFLQSSDDEMTDIVRLTQAVGSESRLNAQLEHQVSNQMSLTSTQNSAQSVTLTYSDKYKLDWSSVTFGIGWGWGYEGLRDTVVSPSTTIKTQDIYSGYTQIRLFEFTTTKFTMNYIKNFDGESFTSVKPQVEFNLQTPVAIMTIRYSFLDERRSDTHPTTEVWDATLKIDLHKNLSMTGSMLQENRRNPDSDNLVVSGRMGLTF